MLFETKGEEWYGQQREQDFTCVCNELILQFICKTPYVLARFWL